MLTTVRGERLEVAWASHSSQSAPTVPCRGAPGDRRSASKTSAASAVDASLRVPRTVRSR